MHIRGGTIVDILPHDAAPGVAVRDLGDVAILPGLIDLTTHANDPGRASWEGFERLTSAAAAGGITTVVDLPLHARPVLTTLSAFGKKREAMRGKCHVDVGLWGGIVPAYTDIYELHQAGVLGFFCSLGPAGNDAFEPVDEERLRAVLPILVDVDVPLVVRPERGRELAEAMVASQGLDPRRYATLLAMHPVDAEVQGVTMLLHLAKEYNARIHISPVSCGESVALVRKARDLGLRITAEVWPLHLFHQSDDVQDRRCDLACAPPIREGRDRTLLWEALRSGTIDAVASGHSPAPPEEKLPHNGDFLRAWPGVSTIQHALPVVWTRAEKRGHDLADIAQWFAAAPAALLGVSAHKGKIAPGCDADIVFFDAEAEQIVDPAALLSQHPLSPFIGRRLKGVVRETWLRGEAVYADGEIAGEPRGNLIMHGGRLSSTTPRASRAISV